MLSRSADLGLTLISTTSGCVALNKSASFPVPMMHTFSFMGRLGGNVGKAPDIKLGAWECFISSNCYNHSGFVFVNETTRSERQMPPLVGA